MGCALANPRVHKWVTVGKHFTYVLETIITLTVLIGCPIMQPFPESAPEDNCRDIKEEEERHETPIQHSSPLHPMVSMCIAVFCRGFALPLILRQSWAVCGMLWMYLNRDKGFLIFQILRVLMNSKRLQVDLHK
ncbi:hypothetical protein ACHAWO_000834 [Cyclotella atomus]|uniref:Uncharacterized protein n=1 Tax=Cyclotella atomus TaxID=382360 RepID=A0ABD3NNY4_9STRA